MADLHDSIKYSLAFTQREYETASEARFNETIEESFRFAQERLENITVSLVSVTYGAGQKDANATIGTTHGMTPEDYRVQGMLERVVDFSMVKTLGKFKDSVKSFFVQTLLFPTMATTEITKTIGKMANIANYEAKRIVNTEIVRSYNKAQETRLQAFGVAAWQWLTVKDEARCKICKPLHGKIFTIGQKISEFLDVGFTQPPAHPNCRCAMRGAVRRKRVRGRFVKTPRPRGVITYV